MKGMRVQMSLNGKTELASTPGQILLQFSPMPESDGLPFHIHAPTAAASEFVVGKTYTITLQEAK